MVLQAFVDQEYLRPALEKVRAILRAAASDMLPCDTKTAPVKRKADTLPKSGAPKKRRADEHEEVSAESLAFLPLAAQRVCRNSKRSKKCLSVDEAKFDSLEQPNCNACLIGYQANGNWTKVRAEKHDATTD